jgi:hypothetical protein
VQGDHLEPKSIIGRRQESSSGPRDHARVTARRVSKGWNDPQSPLEVAAEWQQAAEVCGQCGEPYYDAATTPRRLPLTAALA